MCCFAVLEPTPKVYRVPRVSPGVTAPKLFSPTVLHRGMGTGISPLLFHIMQNVSPGSPYVGSLFCSGVPETGARVLSGVPVCRECFFVRGWGALDPVYTGICVCRGLFLHSWPHHAQCLCWIPVCMGFGTHLSWPHHAECRYWIPVCTSCYWIPVCTRSGTPDLGYTRNGVFRIR